MDCVTLMKLTYNGTFSFVGWNKPRIWMSVIITETLHSTKNNLLGSCIVSSSSTEQGQWVCCKPAWWLQMAPDISMCRTQQFCGWAIASIAYKRFVPPITIHVVGDLQEPRHHRLGIFTSNTYGIGGDHLQELLQKHQGIITLEYPHRPCVIVSVDLHCMSDTRIEAPSWINCVPTIGENFFLQMSPGFVSPMAMDESGYGTTEASVMFTPVLLNRTNGTAGVSCFWVKCSHGRNGLFVLHSTFNVQCYVDKVIQPEVAPYVQGDWLTFQQDTIFPFSISLTQAFPKSNAVHTLP